MKISMPGNHAASELPHGLMMRMIVAKVKSTKRVGLITLINHAVMDGVSINAWDRDLAALITGPSIPRRIPQKAFAEVSYLYQTSLAAKLVIEYRVKRLRGIGSMHHAIWPSPHLFDNVPSRAGVPNDNGRFEAIEGGGYNNSQIIRYRACPNLVKNGTSPSTLVNAAIASFNISVNGSKEAIFCALLAGRQWPFINHSLARLLPDPLTIAGPTLTSTVVVVNVDNEEKISQFLDRLEVELRLLRRYQHVPPDFAAHLEDEDQLMWYLAHRQILNFRPNDTAPKRKVSIDSPYSLLLDADYKVDETQSSFV